MRIAYRAMTMRDYGSCLALWKRSEGIGITESDTPGAVRAYLRRNPRMSLVAVADGRIVGTMLAGHDGRRGCLYHVAVDTDFRGRGIGGTLVTRGLAALKRAGIRKCNLFVLADNAPGQAFWKRAGWARRGDLLLMQKVP